MGEVSVQNLANNINVSVAEKTGRMKINIYEMFDSPPYVESFYKIDIVHVKIKDIEFGYVISLLDTDVQGGINFLTSPHPRPFEQILCSK